MSVQFYSDGPNVFGCVAPVVLAIHDAWIDMCAWVDQVSTERAVLSAPPPKPIRLISAHDDLGRDLTVHMKYYYAHDDHQTIGSMHRWMSKYAGREIGHLDLLFVRNGTVYSARIKDETEILSGEIIPGDVIGLDVLPAAEMIVMKAGKSDFGAR